MFVYWILKKKNSKDPFWCQIRKKNKENESDLLAAWESIQNSNYQALTCSTAVYRWRSAKMRWVESFLFAIFNCLRCTSVQTLIKLPEAALDRSSRTSSQHRDSCFVNLRKKVVSHETHRDALWMITPNWSVTALYACFHLASRVIIKICW